MDNLAHGLAGLVMGRMFPVQHWGRWVLPTAAIAANLPDFEALFVYINDKPNYLMQHRAWSHSAIGVVFESVFLAIVVWAIVNGHAVRNENASIRWRWPFAVCVSGAVLHVFMDWWNTYGIRPLYPISKTWLYADLAFIIDPWMWWLLASAFLLGIRAPTSEATSVLGKGGWLFAGLLWTAASAIVMLACISGLAPVGVGAVWLLLWGATGFVYTRWRLECSPRTWATGAIGVLAVYLCAMSMLGAHCRQVVEREYESISGPMSVNVYPGVPWRMEVVGITESGFQQFSFDLAQSALPLSQISIDANLAFAKRPAVRRTREYEAWKIFARHPVAWKADDRLMLGDLRYQVFGRERDWSAMEVPGFDASSLGESFPKTEAARY